MSLVIELPAQAAARLEEKARVAGVDMPTFVERILQAEASRPPLKEVLRPIRDAFAESGMTEEDLGEALVKAKKEMRAARRGGELQ